MHFKSNQKVFITKNAPSSQLFEVFMASCSFAKGILENNKGFGVDFLKCTRIFGTFQNRKMDKKKETEGVDLMF